MKTNRLIAATAMVAALACSRDSTLPTWPGGGDPVAEPYIEIAGRVTSTRNGQEVGASLTIPDGTVITLIGTQVAYLGSVNDADVVIRGTWEVTQGPADTAISNGPDRSVVADPDQQAQASTPTGARFIVFSFEVVAMQDRPALDGILELTTDGFAVRLANGEVRLVTGCPESIAEHVGQRLWVVGSEDEPPVQFGVIAAVQYR